MQGYRNRLSCVRQRSVEIAFTLSIQVSASEWDACARGSGETNPFLLHAFLLALEESRSAVGPTSCFPLSHCCAYVTRYEGS